MPVQNDNQNIVPEARPKYGATELLTVPNVGFESTSTLQLYTDYLYYFPFTVRTPITITSFTIEVTGLVVGKAVRVGIYRADIDWQPTSLVSDAGTLSVNAVAIVTLSGLNIALQSGRYLIALHSEDAPTLRVLRGTQPFIAPLLGGNTFTKNIIVAKAYAVLANPGTAWDTIENLSVPLFYPVFLTITP